MVDLNVKGLLRRPPPRPRRLRRLPGRREHRALLPQPARVVAELKGRVGQIERLEELRKQGVLTDAEFAAKKAQLLDRL